MEFGQQPFVEAVQSLARRGVLPTSLDTAGLRELSKEVREEAFFSARNQIERVLEGQKAAIMSILEPSQVRRADRVTAENPEGWVTEGFNPTTARVRIKELLQEADYRPEAGEEGTIKDLSSDRRIDLVVDTQTRLAQGRGMQLQGLDADVVEMWPAWELYRQEERKEKRDWLARFMAAGQQSGRALGDGWTVQGGEMVALKGHPIWEALGSSALFDDGLDVSYPPFAFSSGMWVREVDRKRCEELGILAAKERIEHKEKGNEDERE